MLPARFAAHWCSKVSGARRAVALQVQQCIPGAPQGGDSHASDEEAAACSPQGPQADAESCGLEEVSPGALHTSAILCRAKFFFIPPLCGLAACL